MVLSVDDIAFLRFDNLSGLHIPVDLRVWHCRKKVKFVKSTIYSNFIVRLGDCLADLSLIKTVPTYCPLSGI